MRLLAEVAHRYGIPITWAIDGNSARFFADALTEWHESYGDEPLLMLDIMPIWKTDVDLDNPVQSAEHVVTMREKLPRYISSEWNKIHRAMEWATPRVAGADKKTQVLLYALEQAGFKGLWGYLWETTELDIGDDRGCPFGFFYPSKDNHNLAGTPPSRIVGMQRTSFNLPEYREPQEGASHDSHDATLYQWISSGAAHQTFDCYVSSAEWNRWLGYVQYFSAEDLTRLESEGTEQLDNFLGKACKHEATQVMLLSDAVSDYQLAFKQTPPTFLLFSNAFDADFALPNTSSQSTLFYYDDECQFVFERDKMEPIDMKNYVSPPTESRHGVEFTLPKIEVFHPIRTREKLQMRFTLESSKAMPYAFAVWGNHEGLTLVNSNAKEVKWLGDQLLFVRVGLQPGQNEIEVVLTI
ncbi:MAG: hypothetical protein OXN17_16010 [Candidatus Poribacteria bacterium]|nr:hypothetical protein [Candidatus Poribacteria bacterium]